MKKKLNEAGIMSAEELRQVGTEQAFLSVRHLVDDGACIHFLYGIEAAIQDIPKRELTERRKAELRQFFRNLNID